MQLRKGPVLICLALVLMLAGMLLLVGFKQAPAPNAGIDSRREAVTLPPTLPASTKAKLDPQRQQEALEQLTALESNTAALRQDLVKLQSNHRGLVAANAALLTAQADVNRELAKSRAAEVAISPNDDQNGKQGSPEPAKEMAAPVKPAGQHSVPANLDSQPIESAADLTVRMQCGSGHGNVPSTVVTAVTSVLLYHCCHFCLSLVSYCVRYTQCNMPSSCPRLTLPFAERRCGTLGTRAQGWAPDFACKLRRAHPFGWG